jgi:hypothetical protein
VKRDIHELDGSLDKLMDLRGVRFHYKDPDAIGASPGEHVGFIAQEVEEVFPEWIGEYRDGTKTLTIAGFEALAVEALRELRAEKDAQIGRLEAETEALRTRNAELTERLEAIEAALGEIRSAN